MKHLSMVRGARLLLLASCAFLPTAAAAQEIEDLAAFSIEELAQVEVTSASRRSEPLSQAPTALYVITAEEVARSPATSLPELLRQAPNLQVQQIDARQYAISARGFNGYETANKLLAQIDGRSIYTPLFSGILWELHAPLLEDLQQVEVISGPGGTLYGPNAVNGVVSITSKSAFDTLGGLVRGTAGTRERTAGARYGASLGAGAAIRVYGTWTDRESQPAGATADIDDGYRGWQAGFRADAVGGSDSFTLQGDIFDTDTRLVEGEGDSGHNLLARWTRTLSPTSSFQLQAYYDKFDRAFILVKDSLETFDVNGQVDVQAGAHRLVAGVGVRTTDDYFFNGLAPITLDPPSKRLWIANIFAQDEFSLSPELRLIAGVKVEDNSFSGTEILPNLRLAWQPNENALLWSSVSRAVRTPSRIDRDLGFLPILAPSRDFASEKLVAFEAGYRGQPVRDTSLSVNLFYNLYDDLRTTEMAPGGGLPIMLRNSLEGHTYGVEAWAARQVTPWWRLRAGMAALGKSFEVKPGHVDITNGESAGNDPDFTVRIDSRFDVADDIDLDVGLRAVDDLKRPAVKGYVEADARIGWRVTPHAELFVSGTSLLHGDHEESGDPDRSQSVRRRLLAGTRLRF